MTFFLFAIFIFLCIIRVPIAFSLALSSLIMLLYQDFNVVTLIEKLFFGINSSSLMAIPGFILTGVLMLTGGISRYILDCLKAWIGHIPGGMAIVTVLTCMVFASISGSSIATVVAIGTIMIPGMIQAGYDKKYSMGLVATSGTLGSLIPPSIGLIVYGTITNTSVGDLFIASLIPGLLFGFALLVSAVIYARKNRFGRLPAANWQERKQKTLKAIWGLLLPVIIFYCIYGGIATPTETSVIAAFYAFMIGVFVYKEIKIKDIHKIFRDLVYTSSMVYLIIAAASIFSMYLTLNQVPQQVSLWISELYLNPLGFLLLVSLLLLILGTFLDGLSVILIITPILLPVLTAMDINLYYFAIVMAINLEIGMITPPVGLNLFAVAGITREPLEEVIKSVLPFIIIMLIVLLIVILFPQLSLMLIPHRV